MLPKNNRLKESYIKTLYEQGKKIRGEYGMLIVKRYDEVKDSEFAFVVSKKIGNAVQRHKMTRLLREITRKEIERNEKLIWLRCVYVAFKYCEEYEKLSKDFNTIFNNTVKNT